MQRDIEKYTQDYKNSNFEHILVKYRRKKVLEILNKYKPKHILEVGCGLDSIFNHYNDFDSFTIIEPSKDFCENAKKSSSYNKKIIIINDFVENSNFKFTIHNGQTFIIASSLLHEVTEPLKLIQSIYNICNKETIVHINVPNSLSMHLLWAYKAKIINSIGEVTNTMKKFQRTSTFNLKQLKEIITINDFSIIEEGSYFLKPFNHSKMQILLDNQIINDKLLDGLYELSEYFPEHCCEIYVNCKLK